MTAPFRPIAEYYAGRRNGAPLREVVISASPMQRHQPIARIAVAGKAEARKVAAAHGATPWNF
jgi:hypothetical protein